MKVTLEKLTKRFPSRDRKVKEEVIAVSDFDLVVPEGKLIALLGPSGCGKSTILNMISGLEAPSEGRIFFGDEDVTELPAEKRGIGLVFQNYALYPHLTVRQNIAFPLENLKGENKLSKEVIADKVLEAARLVQIEDLLDRKPNEMSGGQQQRVAIARALVKRPKVLLLDEPLSNLDARLRIQTREEIRRIQNETGITTVFVTHDQEEAMSISDMIVVMKKGVLQQTDKPQRVYDNPANLFVAKFLGNPQINVFKGSIKNGNLILNGENVLGMPGISDREVIVAIRPEGFLPDKDGAFSCTLKTFEVMGRDTSVVFNHEDGLSENMRAIIPSGSHIDTDRERITFSLKSDKVFIFDTETEERIYCE